MSRPATGAGRVGFAGATLRARGWRPGRRGWWTPRGGGRGRRAVEPAGCGLLLGALRQLDAGGLLAGLRAGVLVPDLHGGGQTEAADHAGGERHLGAASTAQVAGVRPKPTRGGCPFG
ncbi:hypothetical protein [Micromonospora sp. CA-246542]|uniref:hypothetical protein n=1 Tax=Micromonospora sp. CA-246542 TaxID=3239959 RepID=UPI003D8D80C3